MNNEYRTNSLSESNNVANLCMVGMLLGDVCAKFLFLFIAHLRRRKLNYHVVN